MEFFEGDVKFWLEYVLIMNSFFVILKYMVINEEIRRWFYFYDICLFEIGDKKVIILIGSDCLDIID